MTDQAMPSASVKKLDDSSFVLSGQMVFSTLSQLLGQHKSLVDKSSVSKKISVDCSAVSHLDSAGIALLLEWKKEALSQNKILMFIKLPKQAKAIIHAAHLTEIFAIN